MPTTSMAELAYDLRIACMRLVRRVRFKTSTLPPHLFSVLAGLEGGLATAGGLATRERVSAPSMSRTIGELVERGFVERAASPDDKRCIVLTITPTGSQALRDGRRERDQWMVTRLRDCTPEERALLAEAAVILNRIVEEA